MTDEATSHRPDAPEADGIHFFRRPVPADLKGAVASMVGYREDGTRLELSVEMAPLVVPLIISFGEPFEIAFGRAPRADERYGSFTSGLYPGFVLINSSGRSQCIQIDFTPLGAFRFFRMPMHEISERMVGLDEIADPGIDLLRRRLADMRDWHERLALAEDFVRRRIHEGPLPDARVALAWQALLRSGGATRIGALAARLDVSRKHLLARFRQEIGIAPKAVARMARFNRALALAARRDDGWADVALACGYADQAHFSREFQEFGGRTPGEWLSGQSR